MLVGIHQLHYLPWLRYFEKIARSDVFIALDNVQYNKNGWQNRNRVKGPGGAILLTVPVREHFAQNLDQVRIEDRSPWRRKHYRTLEQCYGKTPYFEEHAAFLRNTYARAWSHLNALNRHMLAYFVSALGITTPVLFASELAVPGSATARLVALVRAAGGAGYYSGGHAVDTYLDTTAFAEAGIELVLQDWHAPVYAQGTEPFIPDLAVFDLLCRCGPNALEIILSGGRSPGAHDTP